jgi:C4-dicarboxylate-specific signal transduction histidine kinase
MSMLRVKGSVAGGIGFASLRSAQERPADMVQRLRLVGDVSTNGPTTKQGDEAPRLAAEQARNINDNSAHAARLELISHLTTAIAHEVNQPLCAIASNAQTAIDLLDMGDTEEVKRTLQDIWSDAQRGSEVIGRIRKMAKKEAPCRIPTNLASVINEIVPLLHREAAARGVALGVDFDVKNLSVECDRVQLQQVVLNLVLNALEEVSEASVGPPKVHIRARCDDQSWVLVTVEDSGYGISAEECERVFAPFFTTKAKGLGMGLAISRSIIVAHGGKIWATPGSEGGSIFHFRLPIACKEQP